jgi:hypothetical protein
MMLAGALGALGVIAALQAAQLGPQRPIERRGVPAEQFIPAVIRVPPVGLQFQLLDGTIVASLQPTDQGVSLSLMDGRGVPRIVVSSGFDGGTLVVSGSGSQARVSAAAGTAVVELSDGGAQVVTASAAHGLGGGLLLRYPDGQPLAAMNSGPPLDPYFNTVKQANLLLYSDKSDGVAAQLLAGPRFGTLSLRDSSGVFRHP